MKLIKVVLKKNGLPHYYAPHGLPLKRGVSVIVETEKGLQFGTAISEIFEISDDQIQIPITDVVRIASRKDARRHEKNESEAKFALKKCRELAQKYELNMRIVWKRSLLFYIFKRI